VAVYKGLNSFRKEEQSDSFMKWLRRITSNKIVDWYRVWGKREAARGGTSANFLLNDSVNDSSPVASKLEITMILRWCHFWASLWILFDRISNVFCRVLYGFSHAILAHCCHEIVAILENHYSIIGSHTAVCELNFITLRSAESSVMPLLLSAHSNLRAFRSNRPKKSTSDEI